MPYPTADPAYLHDYHSCEIPHDCNPALYPIIELHKNAIREYNANVVFTQQQLMLQQDNPFDALLASYTRDQLNNLRVDVYDISVFYLAISLLREHGAALRHWHFLGEQHPIPAATPNDMANDTLAEKLEAGLAALANANQSNNPDGQAGTQALPQVPQGAELANPSLVQGLEEDFLLPAQDIEQPANNNESGAEDAERIAGNSNQAAPNQPSNNSMVDQLLNEFAKQRNGQPMAEAQGRTFSLNLPNVNPDPNSQPITLQIPPELYEEVMLTYLLKAMELGKTNKGFDMQALQTLLMDMVHNPNAIKEYRLANWVQHMVSHLKNIATTNALNSNTTAESPMPFDLVDDAERYPALLQLTPNTASRSLAITGEVVPHQAWQLQQNTVADVLLRLVPFVHRGERIAIFDSYVVLMHPDDIDNTATGWRPLAVFDPAMENVSLGFGFAGFQQGQLDIPVDVNQVRFDGRPVVSSLEAPEQRSGWQLSKLYVLVGIVLLWLMVMVAQAARRNAWA